MISMRLRIFLLLSLFAFLFSVDVAAQSPATENKSDSASAPVMIYHVSDSIDFEYAKPKPFAVVKNIPLSTIEYFKTKI